MAILIYVCLGILAAPAIVESAYLLLLTLLSARPARPSRSSRQTKFDVIVPAHNEATGITRTVRSLRALDWPGENYRVVVVADNCSDETAAVARVAGATVWERQDPSERGKGYALRFAFARSGTERFADAVVVIDADAEASPNLLEAFACRIETGAQAVQAHYGVLNPMVSWRTRLLTIAKGSFHIVRSRARERMDVSCGIRGNGWCVTHQLLGQVPYRAFSLTEDLEYGITLGLAGYRVAYADEAHADADMVAGGGQVAAKQRTRWEDGRSRLVRSKTLELLSASVRRRSLVCLDLTMDLLVMPLSNIVMNVALLAGLAGLLLVQLPGSAVFLWIGLTCALAVSAYVARGWQLSGIGARGIVDLCCAPGFLVWKLLLSVRQTRSGDWVRTERERPKMKSLE